MKMNKFLVALAVCAVLGQASTLTASEPVNDLISIGMLERMGLGDLEMVSDAEGMSIRGKGFQNITTINNITYITNINIQIMNSSGVVNVVIGLQGKDLKKVLKTIQHDLKHLKKS